jgi:hypothetical protein
MAGFTVNFGKNKSGLLNVEYAFLDSAGNLIGTWVSVDGELQPDTGIYFVNVVPPSNAFWMAFRTNDIPELFLVLGLQQNGLVFYFGEVHTGKNISYAFYTDLNVQTGPIITTNIIEFMSVSGIYLPLNVTIPSNAVFVKAWTDDTLPIYVAGAIDFDVQVYTQVPRTGPFAEEIET